MCRKVRNLAFLHTVSYKLHRTNNPERILLKDSTRFSVANFIIGSYQVRLLN